ncbi:uncharacterized protein BO66DRAFT_260207 [Aspergillus aculeatinus CBS 121060]|uniref:Uncharacterized protein n=1 Tax=Aspergillus aculeatinus CBS 121060 TaxID=1448322 RepID=A0ACD1GR99_9EURO|nr:hypothetical protein BO66DRAFT_260207 [Aspergillus aculeatinus CBS 121060]RAH63844.1 hypothetical protein BO66DRAFT_260207 [Aspergillus aculeatinus CBS 121060]
MECFYFLDRAIIRKRPTSFISTSWARVSRLHLVDVHDYRTEDLVATVTDKAGCCTVHCTEYIGTGLIKTFRKIEWSLGHLTLNGLTTHSCSESSRATIRPNRGGITWAHVTWSGLTRLLSYSVTLHKLQYSDATYKHSSSSTFYLPSLALPQTWLSSRCWSDIAQPRAMLHSTRFMSNHQLNAKDGQSSLSMSRGHRGMNKHRACETSFSFLDFTSISRQAPYFPTSRPPLLQKSP